MPWIWKLAWRHIQRQPLRFFWSTRQDLVFRRFSGAKLMCSSICSVVSYRPKELSPARREKWGTVEVWYFIGLLCNSSQCGCVSRWPPLKYPQVQFSNSKQCDNGILWAPTFRLLRSQVHILSNQWHSGTDRNISRPTSLGTELIVSLSRNPVVVT